MPFDIDGLLLTLQKFFDKKHAQGLSWRIKQDNIDLAHINLHAKSFCCALLQDLKTQNYIFAPVEEREITYNNKRRSVYLSKITDRLIQAYLGHLLITPLAQHLSPNCYAYLPGNNNVVVAEKFADYLRCNKDHDIYIVRADIANYFDEIPVHAASLLWPLVDGLLDKLPLLTTDARGRLCKILEEAIRPVIKNTDGNLYQKLVGIPTGLPLAPLISNLYLKTLDDHLSAIPQLFYARYCDDILLAHSDANTLLVADRCLTDLLAACKLQRNQEKAQHIYFTRCGKAHKESLWRGASELEYLGLSINRQGSIALSTKHMRRIRAMFYSRLSNCSDLLGDCTVDEKCRALCQLVRQCLCVEETLHDPCLIRLLRIGNNRSALQQLDFFIARVIAEKISGERGVRAFAVVPYKKLRREYGLVSLVELKNLM
jgi:hypothetical protein